MRLTRPGAQTLKRLTAGDVAARLRRARAARAAPAQGVASARSPLYRREPVDRRRLEGPAGFEHRRRETRLVRRVGEVLCLEREAVAEAVRVAARPDELSVEQ